MSRKLIGLAAVTAAAYALSPRPSARTEPQHALSTPSASASASASPDTTFDSPALPAGHPSIPAGHPALLAASQQHSPRTTLAAHNPLARPGGCPMARHPSSAASSASSNAEPPESAPHLASATSSTYTTTTATLEAGLHPLGELTPDGAIPAANQQGNSPTGSHWLNPSANTLYRALARKQKAIAASDALAVSTVHNAVTDNTWLAIMEYEQMHVRGCPEGPTLARFYGMDGVWSMKARFVNGVLGGPLPFDRHDWVVDRCGKEVKYIIDYYSVEVPTGAVSGGGAGGDEEVEVYYSVDARPAPTLEGLWERGRMAFRRWQAGEQWW